MRKPFSKIVGVELSEKLNVIANHNLAKFRSGSASNIFFSSIDATEFDLPETSNLIFMFNPFDDVILRKFVSRNLEHFRKGTSMIAYANDVHRATLDELGFSTVFRTRDGSCRSIATGRPHGPADITRSRNSRRRPPVHVRPASPVRLRRRAQRRHARDSGPTVDSLRGLR